MEKLQFLTISKHNMNKFLDTFNKEVTDDILLNISNNLYFLDVLASLIYLQNNNTFINKIVICPNVSDSVSGFIIDDIYCEKAGFKNNYKDSIDVLEFFKKYSNSFFYLKTSGSTGEPVLIKKYISQMISEAECIQSLLGADFINKTVCSLVPHYHMYGLTFAVYMPIILNFPVIERKPLLENLSQIKENILITSPEFLKKIILYNHNFLTCEFNQIELIITAGSVLDDTTRLALKNITNAKILNIYGSTETGIIAGDLGDGFKLFQSVKIVDKYGQNELISDWSEPYILKDEVTIYHDILEIHGRSDRIIKIADKRFSLDMIEKHIKQSDLIYDVYAYAVNNRIGALISLTERGKKVFKNTGKKGIVENIEKLVSKTFGSNIRHYKIVSKIYRNDNGKLIKQANDTLINDNTILEFVKEKVEIRENTVTALFSSFIREDIFYFSAHFYNFPLIPGFTVLDHIIKLAGQFSYDFTKISKISNLKFSRFIRPMDSIEVELIMNGKLVKFNIYTGSSKAASGSIKYE